MSQEPSSALMQRAEGACELCKSAEQLGVFDVAILDPTRICTTATADKFCVSKI